MTDRGKKLLVIEDVNFSREALAAMLTQLGCEVDSVGGGNEALAKLATTRYDLIITDIGLRDMDGLTIAETVRNSGQPHAMTVPIVVLTSHRDAFSKEKAIASGVNKVLVKPLTFEKAALLLEEWVDASAVECIED